MRRAAGLAAMYAVVLGSACTLLVGVPDVPNPAAGSGEDGGADGPSNDAHPLGYCASLHPAPLFCEDFDEAGSLSLAWQVVRKGSGTLTVDTESLSPPNALQVSLGPASTDPLPSATAAIHLVGSATRIRVGFDVLVRVPNDTALGTLVTLTPAAVAETTFEFGLDPGNTRAYVGAHNVGALEFFAFTPFIVHDTWTRITLDLVTTPPPGVAVLHFKDQVTGNVVDVNVSDGCCDGGTSAFRFDDPILQIGAEVFQLENGTSTGPWSLSFDNVTLDGNADGGALAPPP